jgi:hypothetical protein
MLIMTDMPKGEVKNLKKGDRFLDSEIINLQKKERLISIVTRDGSVYTIHQKQKGYRVFKKQKRTYGSEKQIKEE